MRLLLEIKRAIEFKKQRGETPWQPNINRGPAAATDTAQCIVLGLGRGPWQLATSRWVIYYFAIGLMSAVVFNKLVCFHPNSFTHIYPLSASPYQRHWLKPWHDVNIIAKSSRDGVDIVVNRTKWFPRSPAPWNQFPAEVILSTIQWQQLFEQTN